MTGTRPISLLLGAATVLLGLLLTVTIVWGQQDPLEIIEFDLGTIGLDTLQVLSPSSVYRPLDMIGVRAGAHQWAMGGAGVARVSGLESVSWNPAGLGWLERSNLMADLFWLRSSGTTSGFPDTFNIPEVSLINVTRYEVRLKAGVRGNLLGAAASRELFGSIPIAGAVSFRRYMDVAYPEEIVEDLTFAEGGAFPVTIAIDGREEGGVDAISASVGVQIVPDLVSMGANLNYLNGRLRAIQESIVQTGGPQAIVGGRKTIFDYKGLSTDLGLQVRLQDLGGLGVRLTPKYTLEVSNGTFRSQSLAAPGYPSFLVLARVAGYDIEVPPLMTVGGVVHPHSQVTVAADYSVQNWTEAEITYHDKTRQAASGLPLRDVTSLNIGLEGRFVKVRGIDLPLRIGYRKGPLSMAQLDPRGNVLEGDWVGGEIQTQAVTLGLGFETGPLRYDLSYEVLDYKLKRFYFDAPIDALVNPQSTVVDIDRRVSKLRLSATLSL